MQKNYIPPTMIEDLSKDSSLQIIESSHKIEFSHEESGCNQADSVLELDYSQDEPSLSFTIEDQAYIAEARRSREINKELNIEMGNEIGKEMGNEMQLDNQPPKRKRREIFQKFKQSAVRGQASSSSITNNQFIKTIDQIFQIDSHRNVNDSARRFSKKNIAQEIETLMPIQSQNDANGFKHLPLDSKSVLSEEKDRQKQQGLCNSLLVGADNDILNLSDMQNRFSVIDDRNSMSFSRDAEDLVEILESKIFFTEAKQNTPQNTVPIPLHTLATPSHSPVPNPVTPFHNEITSLYHQTAANLNKQVPSFKKVFTVEYSQMKTLPHKNVSLLSNKVIPPHTQATQSHTQATNSHAQATNLTTPHHKTTTHNHSQYKQPQSMVQSHIDAKPSEAGYDKISISSPSSSFIMMKDSALTMREFSDSNTFTSPKLRNPTTQRLASDKQITCINSIAGLNYDFPLSNWTELRIPVFLRKFRLANSLYPNFHHLHVRKDPQFDKANVKQISNCLAEVLDFLSQVLKTFFQRKALCSQLTELVCNDIEVKQFLDFPWHKLQTFSELDDLRPRQNFHNRKWIQQQALKALQNYSSVAAYYSKVRFNLSDEKGVKKYLDIRKKFIEIESNLTLISEDLYTLIISHYLPSHYFECREVLLEDKVIFSHEDIRAKKVLMQKLRSLQYQKEELSCSEVGSATIFKLHYIIKMSSCF